MRTNVDSQALTEPRIRRMAKRLQVSHFEVLGRLIHLWNVCYERHDEYMTIADADIACGELDGFVVALITEGMADRIEADTPTIRVRGVEKRITHLEKQSERGRMSGERRRQMSDELQNRTSVQQAFKLGSTVDKLCENVGSTFSDQISSDQHRSPPFGRGSRQAPVRSQTPSRDEPITPHRKNAHKSNQSGFQARQTHPGDLTSMPSQAAQTLSTLMISLITNNHPEGRLARNQQLRANSLHNWSVQLDKLNLTDGLEWQVIEDVIRWSASDPFWSSVVLGADSLIDKWDTMVAQRRRDSIDPLAGPRHRAMARPGPTELARADVEALEELKQKVGAK